MRRASFFGKQAHAANNNNQAQSSNQPTLQYNLPAFLQKKNPLNANTQAKHLQIIPSYDKESLYYQIFLKNNNNELSGAHSTPKAILLVSHSFASHVGQLENIGQRFSNCDFCVSMFDQRGAGRSTGKRGHVKNTLQSIVDMLLVLRQTRKHLIEDLENEMTREGVTQLPVYLYGHGTGSVRQMMLGLIVSVMRDQQQQNASSSNKSDVVAIERLTLFALMGWEANIKLDEEDEQILSHLNTLLLEFEPVIAGVVSTCPYLKVDFPNWQKKVVGFLAKRFQTYTIELDVAVERLTSDVVMQKVLQRDTFRVGDMTARNVTDLEKMTQQLMNAEIAAQFKLPILILHGAKDYVSDAVSSKKFHELIGSADKTHYYLANFLHAIHLEVDREKAFKLINNWLNDHVHLNPELAKLDEGESRVNELINEKIQEEASTSTVPKKSMNDVALDDAAFELDDVEASTARTDENLNISNTDMTEPAVKQNQADDNKQDDKLETGEATDIPAHDQDLDDQSSFKQDMIEESTNKMNDTPANDQDLDDQSSLKQEETVEESGSGQQTEGTEPQTTHDE